MKRVTKFWPWLAAICSGLLYAACFAPFNLAWFCWIALTPLIAAIWFSGAESRHPWLRNLLLGYVAGLTFFWIVFFWLTTVTVLGWFVLQFYMAIYFAIFCGHDQAEGNHLSQANGARCSPKPEARRLPCNRLGRNRRAICDSLSSSRRRGPRLNGRAAGFSPALAGMVWVSRYTAIGR